MTNPHDQLTWYNGDMVLQDYDLYNFVCDNNINAIQYLGDTSHVESVVGNKQPVGNLCVYIVNSPFYFSQVVAVCNQQIKKLKTNKFLYVALNKFLAQPEPQLETADNYDVSIFNFMTHHIEATLLQYHSGYLDHGQRFNWIHPLTRFYFYNENNQ